MFLTYSLGYAQELNKKMQIHICKQLDTLLVMDQKYRSMIMYGELNKHKIDSIEKLPKDTFWEHVKQAREGEIGISKKAKDSLLVLQNSLDTLVMNKLEAIILKYGYPSYNRTRFLNTNIFVLHLIGELNFKRFYPLFNIELAKGNMPPEDYAMWYDRNQLGLNKKQLYGEYNSACPCVEDLDVTNIARLKIGLRPLRKNTCYEK